MCRFGVVHFRYHYAETGHWADKLAKGWTNWADLSQQAKVVQLSTFIQTYKCHERVALSNILLYSQQRTDVCQNGDRRWIFARDDPHQYMIVDLGQTRRISEIGVDFGTATARLPSAVAFSYLTKAAETVDPAAFTQFGTATSNIGDYVKSVKSSGVTARYIMWEFTPSNRNDDATAFMQLIAAGPDYDDSSAGYIALAVIIVLSLLAVAGFMYCFMRGKPQKRKFYKPSKFDIVAENNEFSSDGSDSDSDDSGDDSSESGTDTENS